MKLSKAGLEFIAKREGFRSTAYNDAAGFATIGYGHLITRGPATDAIKKQWGVLSHADGLALLRKDAERFEACVNAVVSVAVTQRQFDALVSFAFNIGCGSLTASTLLKKLNAGDTRGAADEFLRWTRAGGVVLAGLTARRKAERDMFLTTSVDLRKVAKWQKSLAKIRGQARRGRWTWIRRVRARRLKRLIEGA